MLEAARNDPFLFDAALREGRVLVDRDSVWPRLLAGRTQAVRSAATAAVELRRELHALLAELSSEP